MAQTTHRKPRWMHQPPRARVIEFVASDWLAADLAANLHKNEKWHRHHDALALCLQNKYQGML